jgi:hypothetical protein
MFIRDQRILGKSFGFEIASPKEREIRLHKGRVIFTIQGIQINDVAALCPRCPNTCIYILKLFRYFAVNFFYMSELVLSNIS